MRTGLFLFLLATLATNIAGAYALGLSQSAVTPRDSASEMRIDILKTVVHPTSRSTSCKLGARNEQDEDSDPPTGHEGKNDRAGAAGADLESISSPAPTSSTLSDGNAPPYPAPHFAAIGLAIVLCIIILAVAGFFAWRRWNIPRGSAEIAGDSPYSLNSRPASEQRSAASMRERSHRVWGGHTHTGTPLPVTGAEISGSTTDRKGNNSWDGEAMEFDEERVVVLDLLPPEYEPMDSVRRG
ncbi:hypothetical protein C8R44DRAFT_741520 [Mycena epipterygia]|nr:hypothetical protein C8R44DRAFT_741520 [Mycena epipterygia]